MRGDQDFNFLDGDGYERFRAGCANATSKGLPEPQTLPPMNGPITMDDGTVLVPSQGVKHDTGKPDLSLVPLGLVEGCARAMMFGTGKYKRDNWRCGFKDSRVLAACLRHVMAYTNGERNDPESGLCHLDHAAFSLGVVLDQIRKRESGHEVGTDDLPSEAQG